jgi:hypothetical protein
MKTLALLLSAGLVSARVRAPDQAGINRLAGINLNLNLSDGSNIGNGGQGFKPGSFNLGDLDLNGLEIGGLNLGSVDLGNQDVVAEAILTMLGTLCLGDALNLNKILSFGFNNDVDLFFQLAQLMQLEQLGFVDLGGIHSLFNSGLVLGGFNLGQYPFNYSSFRPLSRIYVLTLHTGVFKRELEEAKKTMKRTKLRRGQKVRRQCATADDAPAAPSEEGTFTIATVPNPGAPQTLTATAESAAATEASGSVAATSASIAVATMASVTFAVEAAASSTSVASAATSVAADAPSIAASVVTVAQEAASISSAVAAVASATPDTSLPAAAATSTAAAAAAAGANGGVDNLSDLTR